MKNLYCFIKYNGFGSSRFVEMEDCLFGFDKNNIIDKASNIININKEEIANSNGISYWDEGEYIIGEIAIDGDKFWTIYYENLDSGYTAFLNRNGTNSNTPYFFTSRDEAENVACSIRDMCSGSNIQFLLYPIKVNC